MKGTTNKKVEGRQVEITDGVNQTEGNIRQLLECSSPSVGEQQVIAYIAGDLSGSEHQEFVIHVSQCRYCLREVVSWRVAQVLTEIEIETETGSANTAQLSIASTLIQSETGFESRGRQQTRFENHFIAPELSAFSKMQW
jgi:deoxycytidylate deaminase